jgi:hypothetical protein
MLGEPIAVDDFVLRRDDTRRRVIVVTGVDDGLTGV